MAHPLPANPSWEQLRKQAKEIRDLVRAGRLDAVKAAREWHPRWADVGLISTEWAGFTLAEAQLVVARSYGLPSWRRLREHVDLVNRYRRSPQRRPAGGAGPADELLRLACLTYATSWRVGAGEDADAPSRQADARRLLAAHPELASASIHTAAAVGDVDAARSLLAADASLANREGGPHGWPPLLYLAFSRLDGDSALDVARLLLAHGADPDAGYLPDGEPPPVTALSGAFHGRLDPVNQPAHRHGLALARLLLDAGADPTDERALSNACGYPHDDAGLRLLLDRGFGRRSGAWWTRLGADPTRRPMTPARLLEDELRYAAQWNLTERVRVILRHRAETGVDIDAVSPAPDPCRTAREFAVVYGNDEIADLLTEAGARTAPLDPTYQLVAACLREDRPAVDALLAADAGLAERVVGIEWWPGPVHQAAALGRTEAVELLVSLGFPINDPKGSPLHAAALLGRLDVVRLLVELGADPNAETVDDTPGQFAPGDRTPLGWAAYNHQDAVVAYLRSHAT